MKLIIGLGNPGLKYETTRHNIGFLAVDRLVDTWKAVGPEKKYHSEVYQATVRGEKILLIKPQTFMNLSGKSVQSAFRFYKCAAKDLVVLYDDVDIKKFQMRIKIGGGAGGHNGIRSIDASLGSDHRDYIKIRLGVGRPPIKETGEKIMPTDRYVLQNFSDSELRELDPFLDEATQATELLINEKVKEAMNQFNQNKKDTE